MSKEMVKRDLDVVELCGSKVWANGRAAVVGADASLLDVEKGLHTCVELSLKCDWWIGDIVNQAEAIFGEQYHAIESLVAERAGMALDTIQRHKLTASRFKIEERMACEISKHRMVENMPKPERKALLSRAIEEKLTANDLREILKARKGEKKGTNKHQYLLAKWNVREKEIDMGSLYEMLSEEGSRSFTREEFERFGIADMNDTSTVYVIMKKPIVDPDKMDGLLVDGDEEEEAVTVDSEVTDELVDEATAIILKTSRASTSSLQRRLQIGYTKAANLIEELEVRGIIGPPKGDGSPRDVLIERVEKEERAF